MPTVNLGKLGNYRQDRGENGYFLMEIVTLNDKIINNGKSQI